MVDGRQVALVLALVPIYAVERLACIVAAKAPVAEGRIGVFMSLAFWMTVLVITRILPVWIAYEAWFR